MNVVVIELPKRPSHPEASELNRGEPSGARPRHHPARIERAEAARLESYRSIIGENARERLLGGELRQFCLCRHAHGRECKQSPEADRTVNHMHEQLRLPGGIQTRSSRKRWRFTGGWKRRFVDRLIGVSLRRGIVQCISGSHPQRPLATRGGAGGERRCLSSDLRFLESWARRIFGSSNLRLLESSAPDSALRTPHSPRHTPRPPFEYERGSSTSGASREGISECLRGAEGRSG
jgi:hypothetical protein